MRKHSCRTIVLSVALITAWLMIPVGTSASPQPRKFAVLISTGRTLADDTWYHSEYWYDLVLTYRMLIENGFTHEQIYVLYGDGSDFASNHAAYQNTYPTAMSDYACNRTNIQNIFSWLATGNTAEGIPALTTNDFLFVWWMGHATAGQQCDTSFELSTTGEIVTDVELDTWVHPIRYRHRAFVFMTGHSGGVVDDLQDATTVTMPSGTCIQGAYSAGYDVVHGEWTYWVDGALRRSLPAGVTVNSDIDGNNLVSLWETFDWASAQPMDSTAQLADPGFIARCTFIRREEPGENSEVFARDHVDDDSTVPSNYQTWYHSPDLWVRHRQDGQAVHQNTRYLETNYVYASVHNIGCAAWFNAVTVDFAWVEPSGWSNPTKWEHIGTATIPFLARGMSAMVSVPWIADPPGFACLSASLNVVGDGQNADDRPYMDNNKVQMNVALHDTLAGAAWGWYFFIENGGEELVPIDLVFNTLATPVDTLIVLEFTPGVEFEEVKGADSYEMGDGWTRVHIPAAGQEPARVEGVQLEPGERRLAILTVTLPEGTQIGEEATITFEEHVYGEMMGGIQFVSRASDPETVVCTLMHEKTNVFYYLPEYGGAQVSEICSEILAGGGCVEPFLDSIGSISEFEQVMFDALEGILPPSYHPRYAWAAEKLQDAVDEPDLLALVEAQQEMLLYASILLGDAFTD